MNQPAAPPPTGDTAPVPHMPEKPTSGGFFWLWLMPAFLAVVWSTGFPFAKLGLPYAEPFTFLAVRYVLTAAVFLGLSLIHI